MGEKSGGRVEAMMSGAHGSTRSSPRGAALPRGRQRPGLGKAAAMGLACACLAASLSRANGQLDPAEMQRQVQQQMGGGGSCGGGGGAGPNRIGMFPCVYFSRGPLVRKQESWSKLDFLFENGSN